MKESVRRKKIAKGKKSGLTVVLLCGLVLGIPIALVLGGIAVYFYLGKGMINPLGARLEIPNSKVTTDNYYALKQGATTAEVEAILGKGRAPTASDFDAICGKEVEAYTNPYYKQRPLWEENNRRGLMLIWTNGQARILITFSQQPDQGGRGLIGSSS